LPNESLIEFPQLGK